MTPPSPRATTPADLAQPAAILGTTSALMLIVGIVVGAGIFKAPSLVAGMTGSPAWMFGAWILGGAISIVGALCYAELAMAWPHAGGDYHFLRRAFGADVSFLYAWARYSVIATGSIALLAFVFGDYVQQIAPLGAHGAAWWAAIVIALMWAVNAFGLRVGASAQGWLTALEVGGLLLVAAAALAIGAASAPAAVAAAPAPPPSPAAFGLAMVFVLLTYGGWNEAAYLSAEVRDRRAIVRALVLGIVLITALYLVVNWAYLSGLGFERMAKSDAVAADLMRAAFGPVGDTAISLIVAVSAITSINATMIVGARTHYAAGHDWPALRALARWDARGTPARAMRLQNLTALALVALGAALGDGFRAMVEFTAPVFWLFFLLCGIALFVLRVREPGRERPFRVPLYPLLPALFCASCAYMLWSSLSFVYSRSLGGVNAAWIGVGVLALGLVLLAVVRHRSKRI